MALSTAAGSSEDVAAAWIIRQYPFSFGFASGDPMYPQCSGLISVPPVTKGCIMHFLSSDRKRHLNANIARRFIRIVLFAAFMFWTARLYFSGVVKRGRGVSSLVTYFSVSDVRIVSLSDLQYFPWKEFRRSNSLSIAVSMTFFDTPHSGAMR